MDNLILLKDQYSTTNSLEVAKMFNKEHSSVIKDIENIVDQMPKNENTEKMFMKNTFDNYKVYSMNRDGFILLIMGFTGKEADNIKLKYMKAFDKMEQRMRKRQKEIYDSEDPNERARKWIEDNKRKAQNKFAIN